MSFFIFKNWPLFFIYFQVPTVSLIFSYATSFYARNEFVIGNKKSLLSQFFRVLLGFSFIIISKSNWYAIREEVK
jgi:hypothetical protein